MKHIFRKNNRLTLILTVYAIVQAASLLIKIFFIISLGIYLVAIIVGVKELNSIVAKGDRFKIQLFPFLLFLIANSALFLLYIPTLLLNPEINWHLAGNEYEQDPTIFLAYVPIVLLILAYIILLIAWCMTSLLRKVPR